MLLFTPSTVQLDHMIEVIENSKPVCWFPPELVQFARAQVDQLLAGGLDDVPGLDLELLLVLFELVQIAEKTRVNNGWLPQSLFRTIRNDAEYRNLRRVAWLTVIAKKVRRTTKPLERWMSSYRASKR